MPDIYHIINFISLLIAVAIGYKKLSPKNWSAEIKELQTQVKDLEKTMDRIEMAVEKVRDHLLNKGK